MFSQVNPSSFTVFKFDPSSLGILSFGLEVYLFAFQSLNV